MNKNHLRFFAILLIVAYSSIVYAYDTEIDGIQYQLDFESKTAKVVGHEDIEDIVIPSTINYNKYEYIVSSIGSGAFYNSEITSITIPNTIKKIGKGAFRECSKLSSVFISDIISWCNIDFEDYNSNPLCGKSYKFIDEELYINGVLVNEIEIPNTVTSIGPYAFANCKNIISVKIPNSVISIGKGAFSSCCNLESVNIPDNIKRIEEDTFSYTNISSIKIPNSVTYIGEFAFGWCIYLAEVFLGNSVDSIDNDAFAYCDKIEDIFIHNTNVPYSEWGHDFSLTNITVHVPSASLSLYKESCYWDEAKNIKALATEIDGIYYDLIPKVKQAEVSRAYSNSYKGDITIPQTISVDGIDYAVTKINKRTFNQCIDLKSVVIGNSIKDIGNNLFFGCSSLQSVTLGESVTSIPSEAFYGCKSLTAIIIPNSITSIDDRAFKDCNSLCSVTIGESVRTIGSEAFSGCVSLNSIIIPDAVEIIYPQAFSGCIQLSNIVIGNSVSTISKQSFYGCNSISSVYLPNSVKTIEEEAFANCSSLSSLSLGNSLSTIGNRAFYKCESLISLHIPNSVTNIGYSCFSECNSLSEVTLGENLKNIDSSAFSYCTSLSNISIPNSVENLGYGVFRGCNGLSSVHIGESVVSIKQETFSGCTALTTVSIGNSVETIENKAFMNCNKLTSVFIPNSTKSIGDMAFEGCSELMKVILPKTISTIGSKTFADCKNMLEFICYTLTVPTIKDDAFNGSDIQYATLYVPAESLEPYKSTTPWNAFGTIVSLEGSIEDIKKCATPLISYKDGKLQFTSETNGAQCYYTLNTPDAIAQETAAEDNSVSLAAYYDITCSAKADGYANSETARAKLYWLPSSGSIDGDNIEAISQRGIVIQSAGGFIDISGLDNNERVSFYSIDGKTLGSAKAIDGVLSFAAKPGAIVIAKIGNESIKVCVE